MLVVSTCPICTTKSIGVVEKVAAGFAAEVRCKRCGGCVRLVWPTRFHRPLIQALALGGGLALSFYLFTPVPLAIGLTIMVLAPIFLNVAANTRDPMTARLIKKP